MTGDVRATGYPIDLGLARAAADRFWAHVPDRRAGACWEWRGHLHNGYGSFRLGSRFLRAHRVSWVLDRGAQIPVGRMLDHLCGNRACVNPDHLEPVTSRQNSLRSPQTRAAINASRTHCPQGHPYDAANTYMHPSAGRRCRECTRAHLRASEARRRIAQKEQS